jgi:VanZ family protein
MPFHDRQRDLLADDPRAAKPPTLTRRAVRILATISLVIIVYGTVGPIGLRDGVWLDLDAAWAWLPAWGDTDANDLFTNFVVYLPVGLALRLLVRRRYFAGWRDFVTAVGLAGTLSYTTEWAQQFMPLRSANLVDIVVNTGAAFVGAALAPALQWHARAWHQRVYQAARSAPWQVLGWLAAGLTVVLMTQPWVFRAPTIELALLGWPDMVDFRRILMFAVLGTILTIAGAREAGQLEQGVRLALWRGAFLALGLELAQIVLVGHVCSVREMILAVVGALLGTLLGIRICVAGLVKIVQEKATCSPEQFLMAIQYARWRPVAGAVLLGLVAYLLWPVIAVEPPHIVVSESAGATIPFQAHYYATFDTALADLIERLLLFLLVVLCCHFLRPDLGRPLALVVLVTTLVVVNGTRFMFHDVPADLTTPFVAGFAWLVGTYLWRLLQPLLNASHGVPDVTPASA